MLVIYVGIVGIPTRMFDDGAGMHEYLLCTVLDCGSAC
jgi:hypothetical protein